MAAITGTLNNGYCELYPSGDQISYFGLHVEYEIDAVRGEQAYSIKIRCQLFSNYGMRYRGLKTKLYITCDDQQLSQSGSPLMDIWIEDGQSGVGPWTDWFTFTYPVGEKKTTINMTVLLDLSDIEGSNTHAWGGPDVNSRPGEHYHKIYNSGSVNVDGIVLGEKPTRTSISNNNPYDGNI